MTLLTCDQHIEFLACNHFKGCMKGVSGKPVA